MLRVRLRCSRVCRINHQKCVTFLPIAQPLILSPQNCPLLFHCPKGLPLLLLVSLISTPEHWWLSKRLPVSSTFPNEKASSLVSSNRFPGCWYLAMNEWSICTFVGCVVDVDQNCVACVTHIVYLLLFEIVLHVFVDRTRWVVVNCPWETIRTCRNLPKTERHMQKALFWHILRLVSPDGKHFTQMKLLQQISQQNYLTWGRLYESDIELKTTIIMWWWGRNLINPRVPAIS